MTNIKSNLKQSFTIKSILYLHFPNFTYFTHFFISLTSLTFLYLFIFLFIYLFIHSFLFQIPRFRIVRTSNGEVHAEFLVVVSIGSHSTVTFGLWRRHSDFNKLAMKVRNKGIKLLRVNFL